MKKVIFASIALALSSQALADQDVGCGLGSMLFEGQEGLAPKILAATVNGTSANQSFGITFGTLGCQAEGAITSREKLTVFINSNIDNLARDIAQGEGESLATLSAVWGVAEQDKATFNAVAQQNFAQIFVGENVNSQDVLNNLNEVIANDSTLAAYTLS
jgi:hypothetical protein